MFIRRSMLAITGSSPYLAWLRKAPLEVRTVLAMRSPLVELTTLLSFMPSLAAASRRYLLSSGDRNPRQRNARGLNADTTSIFS